MKNKKAIIITWKSLKNAYSCLLYLKNALEQYTEVELWSRTDSGDLPEKYSKNTYNFEDLWYGKIAKIRHFIVQGDVFTKALKEKNVVFIINDWDFFVPMYFVKKLNNTISVIHYCTEIPGKDVKCLKIIDKFYEKHADFPDMIIDCLKERAAWREKKYGLRQVFYINNTLPIADLINDSDNYSINQFFSFSNNNPILLYAGGANLSRQLNEIINCVDQFKDKLNFLFFCYGNENEQRNLREFCKQNCTGDNYRLNEAIPRRDLLQVMRRCDIGINYYPPEYSINHRYSAPSKFFEYMASGLNIISTNNEGINEIIDNEKIGTCILEGEDMTNALNRLLDNGLKTHKYIADIFKKKYCYEVDAEKTIKYMIEKFFDN